MSAVEDDEPAVRSFPMPRRCPFAPPPEYAELRAAGPVARVALPNGGTAWVVTRHAESVRLLTDPRVSTDPTLPGFPSVAPDEGPPLSREEKKRMSRRGLPLKVDPPEHSGYRRMVIPEFGMRRVRRLRPAIQAIVDGLIEDLLAGDRSADLVAEFGRPLPSLVICELLGVPYDDRDFFQGCTRRMIDLPTDPGDAMAAFGEMQAYLERLVDEAEARPGDHLIGRLQTQRKATGELDRDVFIGMIFQLLVAGHETTANMIPLGALTLLRHPDQLAELRAEPDRWPAAVEELVRFHSITDWAVMDRIAKEDIEIGGRVIRAGDGIFLLGASANHDERVFERADEFDVRRGARNHLGWGHGIHQCVGRNLAQVELEIAYRTLFERLPGLRQATTVDELSFKYEGQVFGLHALPVTW
ncbi:cytochrome P450 [Actinomadura opuntiae]|uniref:cytochrome P450 n=1 Tax=Actinomadura sp. OS1-43 TaxID=604315 RepID=UPI00255A98AD|nr:cytochrome P450 [Actinomadura sp. OS1-43]MDL4815442.1 cytochrome P450 [Actinomadura sp. OS1-43]